jgi:hypothetical protein
VFGARIGVENASSFDAVPKQNHRRALAGGMHSPAQGERRKWDLAGVCPEMRSVYCFEVASILSEGAMGRIWDSLDAGVPVGNIQVGQGFQ